MTATAAICDAFLKGHTLSIKTAFKDFGVTNLPREVGRSIERKFGVHISKFKKEGKSKYGLSCIWFEYRLNPLIEDNFDGIKLMKKYVEENKSDKKEISKKKIPVITNQEPLFKL